MPSGETLASSHAPTAGGVAIDAERRYSDAWQRCDPGNSALQSWCAAKRLPRLPFLRAAVKPAKP
jgi:hypothetical protein